MPNELTVPAATEQMVAMAAAWVKRILPTMAKQYSQAWLLTRLKQGLREGALTLTIKAVEAAEKYEDEFADIALRYVYTEMVGGALEKQEPGHLQVWAYGQRAILR